MKEKIKNFRFTRKAFAYPYMLFLLVFVVTPLVLILANAFIYDGKFSFKNFAIFFTEKSSLVVLGNSILVGLLTTIICIVLGYPAAYFLAKYSASKIFVLLFILPMWVNFLIRTLATKAIFVSMNIPLGMGTVVFGMVYNYLPFMILPLHTVLSSIDKNYIEAAEDLGADKFQVFAKTILPTFAISQLLSDSTVFLFGDSIQMKFDQGLYGVGSVMSLVMIILVLISNFIMNRFSKTSATGGRNLW